MTAKKYNQKHGVVDKKTCLVEPKRFILMSWRAARVASKQQPGRQPTTLVQGASLNGTYKEAMVGAACTNEGV